VSDTTPDRISLTAAELAFLLSVADGAADSPAPGLLGFTEADRATSVIAAGLGSLLLRHLAAPEAGQQVELAPVVAAVAEGLARPEVCMQMGLLAGGLADGALLFEAGPIRFTLAPRAYRCFDVTELAPAQDRRDALLPLAHGFLVRYGPGLASFRVAGEDPRTCWATVESTVDGSWTFEAGRYPGAATGLSGDDAFGRLRLELGELTGRYAQSH